MVFGFIDLQSSGKTHGKLTCKQLTEQGENGIPVSRHDAPNFREGEFR
jgi:hypothetical protein